MIRNSLAAAAEHANRALERLGYPETQRGFALPQTLLTLGRLRLAQNQAADAKAALQAAVRLFETDALDASRSADVGESLLELSRAQLALGDTEAARTSAARALVSLRNGLGPDHELTREIADLASGLH